MKKSQLKKIIREVLAEAGKGVSLKTPAPGMPPITALSNATHDEAAALVNKISQRASLGGITNLKAEMETAGGGHGWNVIIKRK